MPDDEGEQLREPESTETGEEAKSISLDPAVVERQRQLADLQLTADYLEKIAEMERPAKSRFIAQDYSEDRIAQVEDPARTNDEMNQSLEALLLINGEARDEAMKKANEWLASSGTTAHMVSSAAEVLGEIDQARKMISENNEKLGAMSEYQRAVSRFNDQELASKYHVGSKDEIDNLLYKLEYESDNLRYGVVKEYKKHPLLRLGRVFGIKAQFERDRLDKAKEIRERARAIRDDYNSSHLKLFYASTTDTWQLEDMRERVAGKVRSLSYEIVSSSPLLEEVEGILRENSEQDPPADRFAHSPISAEVRGEILRSCIRKRIDSDTYHYTEKLGEQERETLVDKITACINLQYQGLSQEAYTDQMTELMSDLDQYSNALALIEPMIFPYHFRGIIEQFLDGKKLSDTEHLLANYGRDLQAVEVVGALSEIIQRVEKINSGYITPPFELVHKIKKLQEDLDQLLDVNPEILKIYLDHPEIIKQFGEEKLSTLKRDLVDNLEKKLSSFENARSDEALTAERRLIDFADIRSLPALMMCTFTQPGTSGEWPLAGGTTSPAILKYFENLNEEELNAFLADESNRPIANVVRLIQSNPWEILEQMRTPEGGRIIGEMFTSQLKDADPELRNFLFRRVHYIRSENVDIDPFIDEAIKRAGDPDALNFLEKMMDRENFKHTARIMNETYTRPDYLVALARSLVSDDRPADRNEERLKNLQFIADMIERLYEHPDLVTNTLPSILEIATHTALTNESANRLVALSFAAKDKNFSQFKLGVGYASVLYLRNSLSEANLDILKTQSIEVPDRDLAKLVEGQEEVTEQNWLGMLSTFIKTDGAFTPNLSEEQTALLESEMKNPEKMDLCLEKFRLAYRDHLAKLREGKTNIDATFLAKVISQNEGGGHLRHIEAMANLISALSSLDKQSTTSKQFTTRETKDEVLNSLIQLEEFFDKNRWGNEDRSFFYNATREVILAAPSLFTELSGAFQGLDPKQLRDFVANYYPLIQAQIVLAGKEGQNSNTINDPRKLVEIRKLIKSFKINMILSGGYEQATEILKRDSIAGLQEGFKERFGIKKIPEDMSAESIRALQGFIIYFGNLNDKNPEKKAILSLHMALTIDGKWREFREGGDVLLSDYFDPGSEQYSLMEKYLQERANATFIPPELVGLKEEEMVELQAILQEEETVQHFGNIQPIDDKLESILKQLEAFADPDTYDQSVRELFQVINEHSPRSVNTALGKQIQVELGKNIPLSPKEQELSQKLLDLFGQEEKEVKDRLIAIQGEIKTMGLGVSILEKRDDYQEDIGALREKLKPSDKIIAIFQQLGEDFKTESGAVAIPQDLTYLEAIVSKNQDKLTDPEDKKAIDEYFAGIREQMKVLDKATTDIESKLQGILTQAQERSEEGVVAITTEIINNIRHRENQLKIISVCTNRWVQIIENMRQCLACKTNGCNNDTNLTFGDPNKFYLYSQAGERSFDKGSVADEIIFLEPIVVGERQQLSFVFDRVYGNNSPDILIGHILAIGKKFTQIKKRFPEANISMFISGAAMTSAGLDADSLKARLSGLVDLNAIAASANVDVIESPGSDHYIEFGGESRQAGKRTVEGLLLESA